jgi:IS5 family transposase
MGNLHEGKTIKPLLEQLEQNGEAKPDEVIYDRGGCGKKTIGGGTITTPTKAKKSDSPNKKRRLRRRFRRRADIEGIISHLKSDHRMAGNYLHGEDSPQINAMLAAAAWNMTKWMERVTRVGDAFCWLLEKWAKFLNFSPLKWAS